MRRSDRRGYIDIRELTEAVYRIMIAIIDELNPDIVKSMRRVVKEEMLKLLNLCWRK